MMEKTQKQQHDHDYYIQHAEEIKERVSEHYHENAIEINKERREKWVTDDHRKKHQCEYRREIRHKVLDKCGGRICVYCGCTDLRFLEINHKNGGGNKTDYQSKPGGRRGGRGNVFYLNIVMGRRKTDDLEVACKLCNVLHYIRLKFGEEAAALFKITWLGGNTNLFELDGVQEE